jgi:hypothetical protein
MLALEFSITLGRTSNVDLSKSKNRTTLARYHQELPEERSIHPVLLPKAWNPRGAFYYWRKKLSHQSESRLYQTMTPTFVPVRLTLAETLVFNWIRIKVEKHKLFCRASRPSVNSSGSTSGLICEIR